MIILYAITIILAFFYIWTIAYYRYGWYHTKPFIPSNDQGKLSTRVTILVPVRNEEATIEATLQDILNQDYQQERMEIIVVDDFSEDNTRERLKTIEDERLTVLAMGDYYEESQLQSPKKEALALAIARAKGSLIVTTDGDCRMGAQWLSTIVHFYEQYQPKLIAGPVVYQGSNSFLNAFQSLDLLSMMGITCASIKNGLPIMCNGANLAFEKTAFDDVGGYSGNTSTATGDDVFLMVKMHRRYPAAVKFLKAREAVVSSEPQPTLRDFFHQRKRWGSKSTKLGNWRVTIALGLLYLFHFIILVAIGAGVFGNPFLLFLGIGSLFVKGIVDLIFLYPICAYFNQKSLLWRLISIEIAHVAYVVIMGIAANVGGFQWKGRHMK